MKRQTLYADFNMKEPIHRPGSNVQTPWLNGKGGSTKRDGANMQGSITPGKQGTFLGTEKYN
jgi:hypothetical protein